MTPAPSTTSVTNPSPANDRKKSQQMNTAPLCLAVFLSLCGALVIFLVWVIWGTKNPSRKMEGWFEWSFLQNIFQRNEKQDVETGLESYSGSASNKASDERPMAISAPLLSGPLLRKPSSVYSQDERHASVRFPPTRTQRPGQVDHQHRAPKRIEYEHSREAGLQRQNTNPYQHRSRMMYKAQTSDIVRNLHPSRYWIDKPLPALIVRD